MLISPLTARILRRGAPARKLKPGLTVTNRRTRSTTAVRPFIKKGPAVPLIQRHGRPTYYDKCQINDVASTNHTSGLTRNSLVNVLSSSCPARNRAMGGLVP